MAKKTKETETAAPIETIETKTIDYHGLTIRPYGTAKNTKELKPVRLMLNTDAMWTLKKASFEAHCSLGEFCRAIVMQWLSEHESDIEK